MNRAMLAMGAFVAVCCLVTAVCLGVLIERETAKCPRQSVVERQLSPHEHEDNGPTPAGAERRWDEERYSL